MAQTAFDRASATVNAEGVAEALFDVPVATGCDLVRVLLTDPRTGAIREARGSVTVR